MEHQELKTFGFTATKAAQNFIDQVMLSLSRAADAGFTAAPAYAVAAPRAGIIRD